MATRLSRWPFDEVWDEVRHREHDVIDGRYLQLREAGSRLDDIGFDPMQARKRRPWQGR